MIVFKLSNSIPQEFRQCQTLLQQSPGKVANQSILSSAIPKTPFRYNSDIFPCNACLESSIHPQTSYHQQATTLQLFCSLPYHPLGASRPEFSYDVHHGSLSKITSSPVGRFIDRSSARSLGRVDLDIVCSLVSWGCVCVLVLGRCAGCFLDVLVVEVGFPAPWVFALGSPKD